MTPELKIFKKRGEWFYTWKVSSLYTPNPIHGPFESRDEAQEDADRRNTRFEGMMDNFNYVGSRDHY